MSLTVYWFLLILLLFFVNRLTSSEPNAMKYYFKFLIYYFFSICVSSVVWPFMLLRPRDARNANAIARFMSYAVGKMFHIKWVLRSPEILSEKRGAVIVSNHQNTLDSIGVFTIWEDVGSLVVVFKKQVFYVIPFGLAAYLAGSVFIDRNDPKSAYKKLNETSDVMLKNKTKIWLFPEGTRNKDCTRLLPFKKGAFKIAVAAQVPIIPVVFSPYYFINAQKYIFSEGRMIIEPLEAIPTAGLTMDDVPDLIARVYKKMTVTYNELSKEVLKDLPVAYSSPNIR